MWGEREMPSRATPFRPRHAMAMAMAAFKRGWLRLGTAFLLSFHVLLRTGEMVKLRAGDVQWDFESRQAVLHLGLTKGGRRRGIKNEMVSVDDPYVFQLLRAALEGLLPGDRLVDCTDTLMRKRFSLCLQDCGLDNLGSELAFRPYSLRRGGATHAFRVSGSLDRVMILGRWQHAKTARLYIDDAMVKLAQMELPATSKLRMAKLSEAFVALF